MIGVTQRHERHDVLIGLERVAELARFAHSAQELVLGAALTCGMVPALHGSSPDLTRLREGTRGSTGRRHRDRGRAGHRTSGHGRTGRAQHGHGQRQAGVAGHGVSSTTF